jgi:hypothetical protein
MKSSWNPIRFKKEELWLIWTNNKDSFIYWIPEEIINEIMNLFSEFVGLQGHQGYAVPRDHEGLTRFQQLPTRFPNAHGHPGFHGVQGYKL